MKLTAQQRRMAARKGVRTRKLNQYSWDRFYKIDKPVLEMIDELLNAYISVARPVVHFIDRGKTGRKFKHGATRARLLGSSAGGKLWKVLVNGYKRPQIMHAGFWEL